MSFSFTRTVALEGPKTFISRALSGGKFPHALLVHGPRGVGQNALLLDLADILLCGASDHRPCGTCPGCLGRRHNNLDNLIFLLPLVNKAKSRKNESAADGTETDSPPSEENEEDSREEPDANGGKEMSASRLEELTERLNRLGPQKSKIDPGELMRKLQELEADPYGFSPAEKANLSIDQVRDLQSRLAFAEIPGRARVVLILWMEAMQEAAKNTLLKTLEEPSPGTYFLISTENAADLPATVLSRCTQLALAPMQTGEFQAALESRPDWWDGRPPARLVPFAEGSLGVLLNLHREAGEDLLEEGGKFLAATLESDWQACSRYIEDSDPCKDMESSAQLLQFVLRMIRVFHELKILEDPPLPAHGEPETGSDFPWTARALRRRGWDPELAATLGPLERAGDLLAYAAFVEAALTAVQKYSKPSMAILGNYLEFEAKAGRLPAAGVERE